MQQDIHHNTMVSQAFGKPLNTDQQLLFLYYYH